MYGTARAKQTMKAQVYCVTPIKLYLILYIKLNKVLSRYELNKEHIISRYLLPVLIGYIQMPASKGIAIYGTVKAKHVARAQVQHRDAI